MGVPAKAYDKANKCCSHTKNTFKEHIHSLWKFNIIFLSKLQHITLPYITPFWNAMSVICFHHSHIDLFMFSLQWEGPGIVIQLQPEMDKI